MQSCISSLRKNPPPRLNVHQRATECQHCLDKSKETLQVNLLKLRIWRCSKETNTSQPMIWLRKKTFYNLLYKTKYKVWLNVFSWKSWLCLNVWTDTINMTPNFWALGKHNWLVSSRPVSSLVKSMGTRLMHSQEMELKLKRWY